VTLFEDGAAWSGEPSALIPLATALEQPQRLLAAAPAGVWVSPTDEPAQVVPLFDSSIMIAVRFRCSGWSLLLDGGAVRNRHGWRGDCARSATVLRDQLFFMKRVGFDSFAPARRPQHRGGGGLASDFTDSYQGSVEAGAAGFRRIDGSHTR